MSKKRLFVKSQGRILGLIVIGLLILPANLLAVLPAQAITSPSLFEDDFESDLSQWATDGDVYINDLSVNRREDCPGDFSDCGGDNKNGYVVIKGNGHLIADFDTTGYNDATFNYWRRGFSLVINDWMKISWRNGDTGNWTELETTKENSWSEKTFLLDGSGNQPAVQIKLELLEAGPLDFGLFDDVQITADLMTYCGDGTIQNPNDYEETEECDGNDPKLCTTQDNYAGLQTCGQCLWSECVSDESCGDDIINGNEECDNNGDNIDEADPIWGQNEGDGDVIYCSTNCEIDEVLGTWCGDGTVQIGNEQCEQDSDCQSGQTCSNCQCATPPVVCVPGQELVLNGGFESPVVKSSQLWNIFGSSQTDWITDWVSSTSGDYSDQTRPQEAMLELQRGVSGWLPKVEGGDQYAELDGDWGGPNDPSNGEPASVKIYQDIPTIPGYEYSVTFDFSPRPGTDADNNILEFSWDGTVIATPFADGSSNPNTAWTSHSDALTATENITRLQFADIGVSDSFGTFLDNVSVKCIGQPEPPITILAYKVVCENEEDLPNWGDDSNNPSEITATTASDYVNNHSDRCQLEPDWDFQYGSANETVKQDGGHLGPAPAGTGWNDFNSSTQTDEPATATIYNHDSSNIYVRENLKEGYVPFSFPPDDDPGSNISAEMYCHLDAWKYDNYDRVDSPETGETYYCVAFNAPICDDSVYVKVNFLDDEDGVDSHKNGDIQRKIYTGDGREYDEGDLILVYQNGFPVTDFPVNLNQPGLVIERGNGWVRPVLYGSHDDGSWEKANGVLEFSNGTIFTAINDSASGPGFSPHHPFENQGNNNPPPITSQSASDDEYYAMSGSATSDFYMKATTADDSYYLYYNVTNVCEDPDCGNNIIEGDETCDGINIPGEEEDNTCNSKCQLISPPRCGDGILNRAEEQCDGDENVPLGFSCSNKCQLEGSQECSDLVLARVWVDEVVNTGNGNMTSDIYVGSDSNIVSSGYWFPLYENGLYINDSDDILLYENVPGLAVQRLDGQLRVALNGGHPNSSHSEFVNGFIEIYNATVTNQSSDNSDDNGLENGKDNSGVGEYKAGDDEVWISDTNRSNFWLGVTTADDGYYTDWQIVEDCVNSKICGYKWHDQNENGSRDTDEPGLENWKINLTQFIDCQEGDEWADSVVEYIPGKTKNNNKLPGERMDSSNALDSAVNNLIDEQNHTLNFVSLGFRGSLILEFDNIIVNANGDDPDIEVLETSYDSPYCSSYPEKVEVSASQDNVVWEKLENTGCLDSTFDLGSLLWAKYIKLEDASHENHFSSSDADGFDVDGVRALHCASSQEEIGSENTDGSGNYCFENLDPGEYRVQEEIQPGWKNITALFQDVTLLNNELLPDINFGNNRENEVAPGSICGYKYHDYNQDGVFNGVDEIIEGWNISATNGVTTYSHTPTNVDGHYCFHALNIDDWQIFEEMVPGWINTTNATRTVKMEGEGIDGIDFYNYECTDEICDGLDNDCDGEVDEGGVCEKIITPTVPTGGGGGGGGGFQISLILHGETAATENGTVSVTITWFTNRRATSRVVYDTMPHISLGDAPKYGYQLSTPLYDEDPKLTFHTVVIDNLLPDTTYYFLPISSASPEVLGTEISFTTSSLSAEEEDGDAEDKNEDEENNNEGNELGNPQDESPQNPDSAVTTGGIVAGVKYEEKLALETEDDNNGDEIIKEPKTNDDDSLITGDTGNINAEKEKSESGYSWGLWIALLFLLILLILIFVYSKKKKEQK